MAHRSVTIVDYGVGNLFSVRRALERSGCDEVIVSDSPQAIASAERLVLPGVGAFEDGMRGLRERSLVDPIVRFAGSGRPLLGICLGMQMLATESLEFGTHAGLDLVAGRVVPIPRKAIDGALMKVPFIGWTPIERAAAGGDAMDWLARHDRAASVYLVHSFHVEPTDPAHLAATYEHGGHRVTAAIRKDNITGFQFHPEKSGQVGLDILRRFVGSA
jgi:imidazole glycerol-phosphate synthase subunit HisH